MQKWSISFRVFLHSTLLYKVLVTGMFVNFDLRKKVKKECCHIYTCWIGTCISRQITYNLCLYICLFIFQVK